MQQSGPIASAYAAADGYVWAEYILGSDPNATGWAHCICICGCRSLPMQLGGPIAYEYVTADSYAWAH